MDDMMDNKDESDGTSGVSSPVVPTIMRLNEAKAGMTGLDSKAINKTIFNWTNGSHFHSFQTQRQQRIDQQIHDMKTRIHNMSEWQRQQCLKEADQLIHTMDTKRNMSRMIVHIDLDMFFAAVEMKHKPELKGKPIAVGSDQMLATSNYEARKYGIRPGMPGALARRLCPQLILIKHSFSSYRKESEPVMAIIRDYDPNMYSAGLDEAYIDLTDYVIDIYCHQNSHFDRQSLNGCKQLPDCLWDLAAEVVQSIRQRIVDETQLTASAGIACNTLIAKVCSDVNKPDGQHMIRGNRSEIEQFLETTLIRKVCGIGPVRTQLLTALDVKTCKDLYEKRDVILFAFSPFNAEYYLRVGLGIGRHVIEKDDEPRKSSSSERTVGQVSTFEAISELLTELSEELSQDLDAKNESCKTITIKLKKITFVVTLKSLTLPYYTYDSETILNVAKSLLQTELNNTPLEARKYRLVGLKVSNLKSNEPDRQSSQMTLSQIYKALTINSNKHLNQQTAQQSTSTLDDSIGSATATDDTVSSSHPKYPGLYDSGIYECSVCLETFTDKNMFEHHENACIDQMLQTSTPEPDANIDDEPTTSCDSNSSPIVNDKPNDVSSCLCPICGLQLAIKSNEQLNAHIDMCLNKDKCVELTQVPSSSTPTNPNRVKRLHSDTKINAKNSAKKSDLKKSRKESSKSQSTLDSFFRSK